MIIITINKNKNENNYTMKKMMMTKQYNILFFFKIINTFNTNNTIIILFK